MGVGVAMVASMFSPSVGGIQTSTLRLSRKLVQRGARVTVVTRHHHGLPVEEDMDGVRVLRVGDGDAPLALATGTYVLRALEALARRRADVDVIHAQQMLSPMSIALAARLVWGTPIVINPHACGPIGDVWQLRNARRFTGTLRLGGARRFGDAFVAISSLIEQELRDVGIPEHRIHRIGNGIDVDAYRPATPAQRAILRRELGLPAGPLVAYAGRLAPEKGPDLLVDAWPRVLAEVPAARLVVLGDGPIAADVRRRAAELGVGDSVDFRGPVPDTAPWLRACDAFALPSRTEGMPVALLEAMACGLPVVATSAGGTPEFLEDGVTGRLVRPEDPAALAVGLVEALGGGSSWPEAARAAVVTRWSLDTVAERFLVLYRDLLRGRRAPRSAGAPA
jgi:glycosyltransferase involved in cell wall biosynthesis